MQVCFKICMLIFYSIMHCILLYIFYCERYTLLYITSHNVYHTHIHPSLVGGVKEVQIAFDTDLTFREKGSRSEKAKTADRGNA